MKMLFVILVAFMLTYAVEPIKTVEPAKAQSSTIIKKTVIKKVTSYEQQIKDTQAYFAQQMAIVQKAISANEAIIVKANTDNQKLASKQDSLKNTLKVKLQAVYDNEIKKVQDSQNDIDKRKVEIDRIYKEATGLPK